MIIKSLLAEKGQAEGRSGGRDRKGSSQQRPGDVQRD